MDYTKIDEVDIAYQILYNNDKQTMYYKDLILKVLDLKNVERKDAPTISAVYTQINMDGRFQHMGDSMWGLSEWIPAEVAKKKRGRAKKQQEEIEEDEFMEE